MEALLTSPTPSNMRSPRLFHRDTDREIKVLRYCEVLRRRGVQVYRYEITTRTSTYGTLQVGLGYTQCCDPNLTDLSQNGKTGIFVRINGIIMLYYVSVPLEKQFAFIKWRHCNSQKRLLQIKAYLKLI